MATALVDTRDVRPSKKDLIESARSIAREIAAQANGAEANRQVSDAVIERVRDARIYDLFVPKRFGGLEMPVRDAVEVLLELSPLDLSAAWLNSFYVGHNWMWSLLSDAAQQEIFADGAALGPVTVAPTVKARAVEGGYRIDGRSRWGTGISHARWVMTSGMIADEAGGPPEARMFALPREQVRVEDTWYTSGMRATASNDLVFEDIFVPEHRTLASAAVRDEVPPGAVVNQNLLYRTPFTPFLCLMALVPIVSVTGGVIQAAIDRAKHHVSSYSLARQADNPALQIRLAKAKLGASAARTLLFDLVDDLEAAAAPTPIEVGARMAMRAKASYISNLCRDVVTSVAQGGGASGHMADSEVQRAFRDVNMAACHVVFDQDPTMETFGKVLLGCPPPVMLA